MRATALVVLAGCVSGIGHGWNERCAGVGMVMDGVTMSAGTASASSTSAIGGITTTVSDGGETASCRRPATRQEACTLRGWLASAEVKDGWSTEWRNAIIFVGFVAFIVPGVIASVAFHDEESGIGVSAKTAWSDAYNRCIAETAMPGPPGAQ